jgi:hypothetical protein
LTLAQRVSPQRSISFQYFHLLQYQLLLNQQVTDNDNDDNDNDNDDNDKMMIDDVVDDENLP